MEVIKHSIALAITFIHGVNDAPTYNSYWLSYGIQTLPFNKIFFYDEKNLFFCKWYREQADFCDTFATENICSHLSERNLFYSSYMILCFL